MSSGTAGRDAKDWDYVYVSCVQDRYVIGSDEDGHPVQTFVFEHPKFPGMVPLYIVITLTIIAVKTISAKDEN